MAVKSNVYCHSRCLRNNIMHKLHYTVSQNLQIRCVNNVATQNVARSTSSIPGESKYHKFKDMVMEHTDRANRSVLLTFQRGKKLSRLNLENQSLYCQMVAELGSKHGHVISKISLSKDVYLIEFARNSISLTDKIFAADKPALVVQPKRAVFKGKDLSSCIQNLYTANRLSQDNIAASFFVASHIQSLLQKTQKDPSLQVIPFGSTVCGLALRHSYDLDLCWYNKKMVTDTDDYRDELQRATRAIIKQRPFYSKVFPVLHARVPIVKYEFSLLKTNCDLSRGLVYGPLMSEIRYWLNNYDDRFYPLMFAIKLSTEVHGVTQSASGKLSSNTLSALVIVFLQTKGILPPLKDVFDCTLMTNSVWENTYLNECIPPKKRQESDLGVLFQEFFICYSGLDFKNVCIDVFHGEIRHMPHTNAMLVPNPFDFQHNMAMNVKPAQLKLFRMHCFTTLMRIVKLKADSFHGLWQGWVPIETNKTV